jgi:3-oxoacyl-[acyl-carrier-protein] synthase II
MNDGLVAVTGLGCVTPIGLNIKQTWENALAGMSGVGKVTLFDSSNLSVNFAAEVKDFTVSENAFSSREAARFDRFNLFAMQATYEAINDSGFLDKVGSNLNESEIGSIFGVGLGGLPKIEETKLIMEKRGPRRVSPFFIPGIIPNMPPGLITLKYGFNGVNYHISSACASASHAISASCREILSGRQKVMVSGGAESAISPLGLQGFISMKALSTRNDEPTKASRPFDIDRDGFVMGEGSGVLILEDLEFAKKRGAKIYALISGHGATSDAHHITAPHPDGNGAASCMQQAIKNSGISESEISYVNAHGTSTPLGDIAETTAIKKTFKEHATKVNISSTKSMTGHLLGAAGGIESIFCIKAIQEGIIPPTINIENQDKACDLNYTPNTPVERKIKHALNNSFGFGGTNSSIIYSSHS